MEPMRKVFDKNVFTQIGIIDYNLLCPLFKKIKIAEPEGQKKL